MRTKKIEKEVEIPATETPQTEAPRQKRRYTKHQKPPEAAPVVESPAIRELQSQILALVDERKQVQEALAKANSEAMYWRDRLSGLESEVQYRIGIIAQFQGRQAPSQAATMTIGTAGGGISSLPAPIPMTATMARVPSTISSIPGREIRGEVNVGDAAAERRAL